MSIKTELGTLVKTLDNSWTLQHPEHGENYHAQLGAHEEAQKLYIEASGYRDALQSSHQSHLSILDVGLGLGYNALTSLAAWSEQKNAVDLTLVSLEINDLLVDALARGGAPWSENWAPSWCNWCKLLRPEHADFEAVIVHPENRARCRWRILIGAAESRIEKIEETFDFIWQDPFSPAKNPSLWTSAWFAMLGKKTHENSILMTYSVARAVRDHLSEAGWHTEKIPALGGKRHWLKAKHAR